MAWAAAGLHCSANERRADEASRDVEAWLKCKYMREHLGEEYGGVVTSATSFGLFVTLDAMYVEGLVHITELGGEFFKFDEARQELRGERTGTRYAIGTRVRIQVSRVDLDGRRIDFRLVHEGGSSLGKPLSERTAGRDGRQKAPISERQLERQTDRLELEPPARGTYFKAESRKRVAGKPARNRLEDKPVAAKKKVAKRRR